jgi:hypothetical protein
MTVEMVLQIIEELTKGHGTDPEITRWLKEVNVWLVPMVNPDGNAKVWGGSNMWRKNARGNYGVDINRNYPHKWGSCNGSSGSQGSETYRGPSAASEPETKVMMDLVSTVRPVIDVSYHSFSEIVIYPYGCQGERVPAPMREIVEATGKELASKLTRDSGNGTYSPGTSWELLYAVDGGDIDWMLAEYKVLPYVIELNSSSAGFQPNYSLKARTMDKTRAGWRYIIKRVAEGPGVKVLGDDLVVKLCQGEACEEFESHEGRVHMLVMPGQEYQIRVVRDSIQVSEKRVSLESGFDIIDAR